MAGHGGMFGDRLQASDADELAMGPVVGADLPDAVFPLLRPFADSPNGQVSCVPAVGIETVLRGSVGQEQENFAEEVKAGRMDPAALDEGVFQSYLSTAQGPAPDLIIRTSGERRLSNFLLWEAAYAEFVFQDVLWPDYGPDELKAAIEEFRTRERRYGGADVNDALATG